jgi:hypothetical protein
MDTLISATVVHFYDTRRGETLCGLRGFEHRSTKHARGVTCHACVGLLQERQRQAAGPDVPANDVATPNDA